MEEKYQENKQKHQALHTVVNLKLRRELSNDGIFALKKLQELCESGHSDNFVEATNPRKLRQRSRVARVL